MNAIKLEAESESDADARKKLLDAAKSLADATSRMVESAKVCCVYVGRSCVTLVIPTHLQFVTGSSKEFW